MIGLFCCACSLPACAQDLALPDDPLADPDRWLSDQRWSEVRYGLSIREPHEPIRIADTPSGEVIRWALPDGVRFSLAFARGIQEFVGNDGKVVRLPVHLDLLKKRISDEMKGSVNGDVINLRADQVIEVGPLKGVINYFVVRPGLAGAEPFLYGVGLLQLDPMSVAIIRMECPPNRIIDAVSTFECMVHSIAVEPAEDVNRRFHEWLSNSETLLADLTQQDRLDAMRGDRVYRVVEGDRDLGFVRVWQRYQDADYYEQLKDTREAQGLGRRLEGIDRFGLTGNAVFVQMRLQGRGGAIERLQEGIDAMDGVTGFWQIKNSLAYKNNPTNRFAGSWAETGVRGVASIDGKRTDHLQLTREGTPPRHMVEFLLERERDPERKLRYPSADPRSYPSGDLTEHAWPTPRRAFLSFVDAMLMPALLPREEKTYLFTAYHPETTRIDFRLMRVEPNSDGGKTVYVRPVLDLSEQAMIFDRNNELMRWSFPDGRELRQTTREELARIWGTRLRD